MNNYENALRSLASIKKVDDYGMFQMTYYGDYGFDDFLKVGAKSDEELNSVVDTLIFKDMNDIEARINTIGGECTAFTARNAAGDVIYGRNYDFQVYSPPMQLTTRPSNGYASISTSSLMYLEYGVNNLPSGLNTQSIATLATPYISADGVNEKGVAIALLSVAEAKPSFDENKITLNTTTAIRLVLDKAASADEAVELLSQYNMFFSFDIYCHYFIADASGRSLIVEYWDNDLRVTETHIASNFIAYNDLRISQGNAIERYDKVDEVIESNSGILSRAQTIDLLVDIGWKSPEFGNGTQWSAIFNLSTLEGTIFADSNTDNLIDFRL